MIIKLFVGLAALGVAYLIFNALFARLSPGGRLAAKIRSERDDQIRKGLVEELVSMSKDESMRGDAALMRLASLCLGDSNKEIKELADNALEQAGPRALFPLIRALDSPPARYRACLLLEGLADPRARPRLQAVATNPKENPTIRHAAMRAIQMIQTLQGR